MLGSKTSLASTSVLAVAAMVMAAYPAGSAEIPFALALKLDNPRPVVTAEFNGHPMPMMVHSAANFYSQLDHKEARDFGVRLDGDHQAYGIDRPGHVSALGSDRGVVAALAVAGVIDHDAAVSVFETPQDELGMLGTGWIRAHRAVLDFGRRTLLISPTRAGVAAEAARLRRAGFTAVPLHYDPANRFYTVTATINGVSRVMTVATASQLIIDSNLAGAAHLRRGEDVGSGSGPTGAHVPEWRLASPVRIRLRGWTSPPLTSGRIQDVYAYGGARRPKDASLASGGLLGGDFLTSSQAVVDFGTALLYVK